MNHYAKGKKVSAYGLFYKSKSCLGWVVHGLVGYDWQNANDLGLLGEDLESTKGCVAPIEEAIQVKDGKGKYYGFIYVVDMVKETNEADKAWLTCTKEEAIQNIKDCYPDLREEPMKPGLVFTRSYCF